MSYAVESVKDSVRREMLIVLKPKRRIESTLWTLHSGNVYVTPITYGYVTAVAVNGTALTAGSSASLSAGQFYFDYSGQDLYIRKSNSAAPQTTDWVVITFEIHLAQSEFLWHRNPLDSSTDVVLYRGLVKQTPTISRSSGETLFGFAQVEATSFTCVNESTLFQELLYDASFANADVVIYHLAGKLAVANIERLHTGLCGSVQFTDLEINFPVIDKSYRFDETISNDNGTLRYPHKFSGIDGTGTDPAFADTVIRNLYGCKSMMRGVCIDYNNSSPTTSQNRSWAFCSNLGDLFFTTVGTVIGDTSTTVKTFVDGEYHDLRDLYLSGITSIKIGGSVTSITGYDDNTQSITISPGGSPKAGQTVESINFANVYLVRLGSGNTATWYSLTYSTHWSPAFLSNDSFGITLINNVEGALGISTINPETDIVIATAFGTLISPTVGGGRIPAGSSNPIVILYHLLLERMGMAESEINTTSILTAAEATFDIICTVRIPDDLESSSMPTYREVIARLLATAFCRAYIDGDGKFTVVPIGAAGTPALTLTDDDIISLQYESNYDDVGRVELFNGPTEAILARTKADILASATTGTGQYSYKPEVVSIAEANYEANDYIHERAATQSVHTYFNSSFISANPTYANRIAQMLGERRGRVTCFVKVGAHGLELGDTVRITRERQPGFDYSDGTTNSRDYVVVAIKKEVNGVSLVLDDQKGIQDNTGDW